MSRTAADRFFLSGKDWFLIFLAALLIHVVLFLLFRPIRNLQENQVDTGRFTIIIEEKDVLAKPGDPYGLKYWMNFMTPEQLLMPNLKYGFSSVCLRKETHLPDPLQVHHSLFDAVAEYHDMFPVELPQLRDLSTYEIGDTDPLRTYSAPEQKAAGKVQYPVWTDEAGNVTYGLFLKDAESSRLYSQQIAFKATILKLQLYPGKIPRIDVMESCGNRQLDKLGKRQLAARRENYDTIRKPLDKYFRIDWFPRKETLNRRKRP